MGTTRSPRRSRGTIDELPSGALRVRVYAGIDPLTKRCHDLVEVVPAGSGAEKEAERVRTRLFSQVDECRQPRTKATVNQPMDRYLELLDVGENTKPSSVSLIDNHIRRVRACPISGSGAETVARLRRVRMG